MICGLLVLLLPFAGIQVEGLSDGDSVIDSFQFEVSGAWDLKDFIGLEVTINGTSVAYFSEPPFKGDVRLEPFPEGELDVRFTASFFGGKEEVRIVRVKNIKSAYEQLVHLIQIPVTLEGFNGSPSPAQFQLKVNGANQTLSHVWGIESPLDLVILLDTSGSMKERFPIMRLLIRDFLSQLKAKDRVKVIGFYHQVYEITEFTSDKSQVSKNLLSVKPGGDTNLYGALWAGVLSLTKAERRRGILLLTDGRHQMEFTQGEHFHKELEDCIDLARKHMVPISVLGIGHGTDPEVLHRISEGTSGRYFQSTKRKRIEKSFKTFLADLRQQVVLGYYHEAPSRGWHDIQVVLTSDQGKSTHAPNVFL